MFESYSTYIWSCYGITAAVLVLILWLAGRDHANELQNTRRRQEMNAGQQS